MPTLQGRGYGRALVAAAYHLAAQRDAIDLTVRVWYCGTLPLL